MGPFLYGATFVVLVPALLVAYAGLLADQIRLPLPPTHPWGELLLTAGLATMSWAIVDLRRFGGGLPMNAFPPPRYVTRGVYRYVGHPIYVGFVTLAAGASLLAESAAGLYWVTPFTALSALALVWGYERIDLDRRFGSDRPRPITALPRGYEGDAEAGDESVTWGQRFGVLLRVLLPWLCLYECVVFWGPAPGVVSAYLEFEHQWPVFPGAESIYITTYGVVTAVPLILRRAKLLGEFSRAGIVATITGGYLFLVVPLAAQARPFEGEGLWACLLNLERSWDHHSSSGAFPAFHVIWSILAAWIVSRQWPRLRLLATTWCVGVALSCILTGMHALVDLVAGALVAWGAIRHREVWQCLLRVTERIANSWREWRWGPVRFISHGVFAGCGAFVGWWVMGDLVGREHVVDLLVVSAFALVGAALWAQLLEGGIVSLRPFGYYGGVLGTVLGGLVSFSWGADGALLLAAFAVVGPLIQAFGRLRCLVQGCCHGRAVEREWGICFHHRRSRVLRLASLGGIPLHPTQLYSLLWNLLCFFALWRLWYLGVSVTFIGGTYLMLNGLGRFVEEAYRGEPQTPQFWGLAMYQWLALISLVGGAGVTTLSAATPPTRAGFDVALVGLSGVVGVLVTAAMGLDFPRSRRRFSRLV